MLRERIAARPGHVGEARQARRRRDAAEQYRRLRLKTIDVERNEVLKIRSSGTVDHDIIEEVLGSFDIEESMLTVATERSDRLAEDCQSPRRPLQPDPAVTSSAPAAINPNGPGICEDCIREGTRTVHLRICLSCGTSDAATPQSAGMPSAI